MATQVLDDLERERPPGCAVELRVPSATGVPAPCFAQVYDRHFSYVHRAMRHLGVRDHYLDDAVQDVFMVVHEKLPDFDGKHPITTWLYAIVIRIARRYRKTQLSMPALAVDDLAGAGTPHDDVALRQKLAIAQRALDGLDKDKREAFVLAEIEQLSVAEIAAVVEAPIDTVYSRLRAAREAFARATRRIELTLRRAP